MQLKLSSKMNVYTISLFSHLMIMFCFYYLLTVCQPLEVTDKITFLTDIYMSGFRS